MITPIGQDLLTNSRLRGAFAFVGILVVVVHMSMARQSAHAVVSTDALAALVLLVYVLPSGVRRESLGLRLAPLQSIRYWCRFTAIVAAFLLVAILAWSAIAMVIGLKMHVYKTPPHLMVTHFVHACLVAPLVEELLYRFAICVPATAIVGPTGAILLSGTLFAGVHFVYGNPGPDNFLAGYVLAWAYLKSGSIVVPITLHALGNGVAVAVHGLAWFIYTP